MASAAYIRAEAEAEYARVYGRKPQFNDRWTDFYNGYLAGYRKAEK